MDDESDEQCPKCDSFRTGKVISQISFILNTEQRTMPKGKGTYGSKRGKPPKKSKRKPSRTKKKTVYGY